MRPLLALLCAVLACAVDPPPADLGGPAPPLAGLAWRGAVPPSGLPLALLFWSSGDGGDQPALDRAVELAGRQAGKLALALVCDADDPTATTAQQRLTGVSHAIATGPALATWLGSSEPALPGGALVGADGILLWRGHASGLAAAVAREREGGFDRAKLAAGAKIRAALRTALAADRGGDAALAKALELTAQILALEPADEEAVRLRLDLCHHLGKADEFSKTLAGLPVDRLPAALAASLAWDRLTDQDLAWRHPDLALRLAEHACALEPGDAGNQDTMARALYTLGLLDDAIATQIKAVSLAPDDADMRAALDYYREVQALRAERLKAGKAAGGLPP